MDIMDKTKRLKMLLLLHVQLIPFVTSLRMSARSLVNPVKETDMISIHCEIWGLQTGQGVTFSRQTVGESGRISWNGDVLTSVDDRFFLATRNGLEGSIIYLLTITDVNREDEGTYSCKVIDLDETLKANASVKVTVQYFISGKYPDCSSGSADSITFQEGDMISFACTSEMGNPEVTLSWELRGEVLNRDVEITRDNGIITSTVNFRVSMSDSNALFLCKAESYEFPGMTKKCHIGPIIVRRNSLISTSKMPRHNPSDGLKEDVTSSVSTDQEKDPITKIRDCSHQCSSISATTETLFWIICTVTTGIIAMLFCIVTFSILIKMKHLKRHQHMQNRAGPRSSAARTDAIYEKLEHKLDATGAYMSLDKSDLTGNQLVLVPSGKTVLT